METATRVNSDMSAWVGDTRHYTTSDGHDYAVEASADDGVPELVESAINELMTVRDGSRLPVARVVRPTVVFECNPQGQPVDLTPVRRFPPGTTHEAALTEMGYEVAGG